MLSLVTNQLEQVSPVLTVNRELNIIPLVLQYSVKAVTISGEVSTPSLPLFISGPTTGKVTIRERVCIYILLHPLIS